MTEMTQYDFVVITSLYKVYEIVLCWSHTLIDPLH